MIQHQRTFGGVLLVAGTTIGAAMLALPVSTGMAGFVPTLCMFVAYWALMSYTALLMLEVTLWMGGTTNLVTMAQRTLGKWGEGTAWVLYLLLLYALTVAYMAGSSSMFREAIYSATSYRLPEWAGPLPLLLIFSAFVYQGTRAVDMVNRLLMLGLVIAYGTLVWLLAPHVDPVMLERAEWPYLGMAVSLVATSFGFHIIIPSLAAYLDRDVVQLRRSILIGSFVALVVYIVWDALALGIIPIAGADGIIDGYTHGDNGIHLLTATLGTPEVALAGRFLLFFAIVTSFLGVSLSLRDFLADGFAIKGSLGGKMLLYVMTFVPPLLIVWTSPRAFLSALEFAGAYGVVTLLGIFPALMVWSGRNKNFESTYKAPGGKLALAAVIILCIGVILAEVANKTGILS